MRIQSKIKHILLFLIIFLIVFSSKVLAASISVGPSKSSVSPGESFSVSVNANGATGKVSVSVSNGSASKNSLWLEPAESITVTAGSSGTVRISVTATDMSDASGNEVFPSGSASVNIVVPQSPPSSSVGTSSSGNSGSSNSGGSSSSGSSSTSNNQKPNTTTKPDEVKKSSDSTLKNLSIEGQELYPEFNPATKEYNVKVPNDITSVKIIPELNDSKASFILEGTYENLVVGENIAGVATTAEDGSTNRYIIKINRERESLKLQTLKISYVNELGNEVVLTPELVEGTFEYILENIPYYIEELDIEVLSNLENAKIEIIGNKKLAEEENVIIAKITMPSESEEVEDEILEYSFIVNKEKAPKITFIGKIQNLFNGITGTIGVWYIKNQFKIVFGALVLCSVTLGGLSVYLAFAYKKYRLLVKKVAEITRINTIDNIKSETVAENVNNLNLETKEIEDETTEHKGRHF